MFSRLRSMFAPAAPSRQTATIRAGYDNAKTTDENRRNWQAVDYFSAKAANSYSVRRTLRTRSRHEVANNPFLFGITNSNADDLIDSGPTLQLLTPNKAYNRAVEASWRAWCQEVEYAEKLRTCKLAKGVDGEGFLIFKTVKDLAHPVKMYPCDVEADQVTTPAPANIAELWIDGLTLHPVTGRPVSYHVLKSHPGDFFFPDFNPMAVDVIPKRNVIHWFAKFRPGQVRGVPVFTASLDLFAELRAFRRAVLGAAEIAADYAAVLESEYPAGDDASDAEVVPFQRVPIDRKMMVQLPHGMKMSQFDAKQPTTSYQMFQEKCIAEACRPLNYPLNLALGTSQAFNFSSAKLDHVNYRNGLTVERAQAGEVVLTPTFREWFAEAVLCDAVKPYEGGGLPPHEWHWPGFEPLDPVADATADHDRIAHGTLTWREFWARRGYDWQDVFAQHAAEKIAIDKLGLTFGEPVARSITESVDDATDAPADQDAAPKKDGEVAHES